VNVLSKTLQEEKDTDSKLSELAEEMTVQEDNETRDKQLTSGARKGKSKTARA
jgi:ferritin-like metal-binding protein YciE